MIYRPVILPSLFFYSSYDDFFHFPWCILRVSIISVHPTSTFVFLMLLLLVIISYFISTNPLNVPFWYPHVQDCLQHFHQPVERIACCVVGENVKVATTAPPPYLPSDGLAVLSRLAIRSNEGMEGSPLLFHSATSFAVINFNPNS